MLILFFIYAANLHFFYELRYLERFILVFFASFLVNRHHCRRLSGKYVHRLLYSIRLVMLYLKLELHASPSFESSSFPILPKRLIESR